MQPPHWTARYYTIASSEAEIALCALEAGVSVQPSEIPLRGLVTGKFAASVVCFTVPRHGVTVGLEADQEDFHLVKEAVLRQLAKVDAHASTDFELSRESSEGAVVVAPSVLEVATADPL